MLSLSPIEKQVGKIRRHESTGSSDLTALYVHPPAGDHTTIAIIQSIISSKNNNAAASEDPEERELPPVMWVGGH